MGKCRYCHFEKNGDIPEDRKDLIDKNVLFPFDFIENMEIKKNIKVNVDLGIYSMAREDKPCFGLSLKILNSDDETYEKSYRYAQIPIKYCPMCGRKITVVEE